MKIDHLRQHHHVSEYITIAVLITLSNTDSALCVWFVTFFQDVLRHSFEKAVTRRMMSDVPWGVLLSGGLDSSLVASICARNVARRSSSFPKLHSFTIGLENSPDLKAAKRVADFLGTIHHAYTYTLEEGADAIRDVIRSIETYDVTTIRASTPMYLMSRKIKAMGIKMVLSGEGADEVFGGYLYFHKAPNEQEFFDETVDKISRLHMYDCLRANKAMSAWGVEPRCPFLDADFLQVAMNLDPKEKMIVKGPDVSKEDTRIEKYVIRKAFDTPDDPYLPQDILWRQKEQFSDGESVLIPFLYLSLYSSAWGYSTLQNSMLSVHYVRCWLWMGRQPKRNCGTRGIGSNVCQCRQSLPLQHTHNERRLQIPYDLRGTLPGRGSREDGAWW